MWKFIVLLGEDTKMDYNSHQFSGKSPDSFTLKLKTSFQKSAMTYSYYNSHKFSEKSDSFILEFTQILRKIC